MRIGISLNGEGRGHLTRISAIAQELQKRHEIIFWVPETRYSELGKLFPDTPLNKIPAFELPYTERNQVDIFKTGSNIFTNILGLSSVISDIRNQIDFFKPDIILSDFEPIVPGASKNLVSKLIAFLRNINDYKQKKINSEIKFNFKDNTKDAVYLLETKFISLTMKRAS